MSNYPHELKPSMLEIMEGSDGRRVEIPKTTPRFLPWAGTEQLDNYGGKAILDFEGQPYFADLKVLAGVAFGWILSRGVIGVLIGTKTLQSHCRILQRHC
jgi:hypothetical protein